MEESARKMLFYETRHHASRPYIPTYPPQADADGAKRGLSSLLSLRGVSQLKDRWSEYWHSRTITKPVSLFISPRGERVAVAAANHITILLKEDDYLEPFGTFTSSSSGSFTSGVWSETHDILGVADDSGTVFFIKANGEEISRVTKKHLNVSSSILGLIEDDNVLQGSCLCTFSVLTSNGILHHVEISRDPSASVSSRHASSSVLPVKRQFPRKVFCFNYHPDFSTLAVIGSAGSSYISLWRKCQNSDLELLFSTNFEGFYAEPKGDQLAYPKVLISPQGTHVATLDMNSHLHIFELDKERGSLSNFVPKESSDTHVVDFTWWSDHILALVKRRGNISMFDIRTCATLQEDDPVYSMPVVERVPKSKGNLFLLESSSSEERLDPSNVDRDTNELHHLNNRSMNWKLISLSEKTIPEMYNILIRNRKYQEALDFADSHGLDRDEVLKSKWSHSNKGTNEINVILSKIKDQAFVVSECVDRVGPTEDSVKALLAYGLRQTSRYVFSELENQESNHLWDFRMARLQLLQFSDRLETFLGINMGRFSMQEYSRFRIMPINEAAVALAESGKIGALNLLFKRHPYSLAPFMLQILAAIPETVPVQTYVQLLPGRSPPSSMAIREEDWVECERMVSYINKLRGNDEINSRIRTEPLVRMCMGSFWPSIDELFVWYKNRAKDIDSSSGQLDNCLFLVDFAYRKGISELQQFQEDISYLHQIIYSDDNDSEVCFNMSLAAWEQLSDYQKFKSMLEGVKEENVVKRLHDKAIPFLQKRCSATNDSDEESFLVKWLKEIAAKNNLDLCSTVLEEGCVDIYGNRFFKDEAEVIDCAMQCIYLCTLTDRWSTMATILTKLPQLQDAEIYTGDLEKRLKIVEGHVEAGRLLAFYQVPKPINFFLEAYLDEKSVKQIFRLMLSKFVRRQPSRSDNDWASMWRDLQYLREKAFHFLDPEYMLTEFCRGLLKAGKFSLARNYLKGTSSVAFPSEKAENLVVQAAREYFFSASSLASEEIWKARECLNIFPSSRIVKGEADIIDAITVKLPDLGVTLLPVQFRQIKDPMEIIKMAITGQGGAYLHVDELIEVAKLLGLNSSEDISSVEEAIAREAAVAGDLQLAFDLCLALTKKGHGPIWDLCAALARGPALEDMGISSRKQLLGFALGHCDDESIGELLHAWKDLDLQGQCENLEMSVESNSSNFSVGGPSTHHNVSDVTAISSDDQETQLNNVKSTLYIVAKNMPVENGTNWDSLLTENGKLLSFAASKLPWLLELSRNEENNKRASGSIPGNQFVSAKTTALITILSWLARNGFAPNDDLIASLTKSIIEPPVTKEEDIIGCSFLLNLIDPSKAVDVIEEQLRMREKYQEYRSIMNLGMTFSLLHDSGVGCEGPSARRELLWRSFKKKHMELNSDEISKIEKLESTFWREWKMKLEEKMRAADRSRVLEQIIPGVETARFFSGDVSYIQTVVFTLIESVKLEKKQILKDVLELADTYGLKRSEVILRYLNSILVSDFWTNEDITAEICEVREEILSFASETIKTISTIVYPAIDGCNKLCLACIYGLLSECYLQLEKTKESSPIRQPDQMHGSSVGLAHLYKILEQECRRVSFIENLNFKNIAGLDGLNWHSFNEEVSAHINGSSLEPLARMVESLLSIFAHQVPEGLISQQHVYKHYILSLLDNVESQGDFDVESAERFLSLVSRLEQAYDHCKIYMRRLKPSEALDIMKRYFTSVMPRDGSYRNLPDDSAWQECLILLLNFWIRLAEEMQELISSSESAAEILSFSPECIKTCLKVLIRLVMDDSVSPSHAWAAILGYLDCGLLGDFAVEIFNFCRAMVFCGCGFGAISEVFSEAVSEYPTSLTLIELQDLLHLYSSILEPILQDVISGSHENQKLYLLLSSLSNLEGDLEELKRVRHVVWEKLANFSENLELPSQVRVYALELMQFISGRSIKGFTSELQSHVLPWEGWNELLSTTKTETEANQKLLDHSDGSNRFTSTLVALRSSQIAAAISSNVVISPEDLSNIEAAVSCFSKLCASASTGPQVDALLAILEEWEGLFDTKKSELPSAEVSESGNDWVNDDWDEGWESLQDAEPPSKETNKSTILVHPLHLCWVELFKKYIALSRFRDVLRLIDQSSSKGNGVLVDENGAESLTQVLIATDRFLALEVVLLLPYEGVRLRCLSEVEDKLKQRGISNTTAQEHYELLLLVLCSGILSTIISKSSYDNIFSYVCFLVGHFSRQFQETQLARFTKLDNKGVENNEKDFLVPLGRILFPCFISELVKADQQILAGLLVTKFMHTNPSLSLVNIAQASLRTYLEKHLDSLEQGKFSVDDMGCETLKNTISSLRGKSGDVIRSAVSLLSSSSSSR